MENLKNVLTVTEYNLFKESAERLGITPEELISFALHRSLYYCVTTESQRDRIIAEYKSVLEIIKDFCKVMAIDNYELYPIFAKANMAYDFLKFLEHYDDEFRMKAHFELCDIYIKVKTIDDGEFYNKSIEPMDIKSDIDLHHAWAEYFFLNSDKAFSKYLRNRLINAPCDEIKADDLPLEIFGIFRSYLYEAFRTCEFHATDAHKLAPYEIHYFMQIMRLVFKYGEYVSSLIVIGIPNDCWFS